MGRVKRKVFLHGTKRNPQLTLAQAASAVGAESKLGVRFTDSQDAWIDESLVAELQKNKVKFSREDMVFITRDKSGQIIWLERGKDTAGLKHMSKHEGGTSHIEQFMRRFHVSEQEVPGLLRDVISRGSLISERVEIRHGRESLEKIYRFQGKDLVLAGIGSNGFIVSMYPISRKV